MGRCLRGLRSGDEGATGVVRPPASARSGNVVATPCDSALVGTSDVHAIRSELRVYRRPWVASTVNGEDTSATRRAHEPAIAARVEMARDDAVAAVGGDAAHPFRLADALVVVIAALTLAAFEGPVSLRKLRANLAGVPSDVPTLDLVLGRLVWAVWLTPGFLILWRLGARQLARRRGLDERTSLAAEALPFIPFAWLAVGFAPGWGNTVPEAWSSAMLLLFLGIVATSSGLRLALWHSIFLGTDPVRRRAAILTFLVAGGALAMTTHIAAPIPAQPHWSSLADRSPYWPTRAYLALWSAWLTWLSMPILATAGMLLAKRRRGAARVSVAVLSGVLIALGLIEASSARDVWDRRFIAAHHVPGKRSEALVEGRRFAGIVVLVPGEHAWELPPREPRGRTPTRLEIRARIAPFPQASYWYRWEGEVELELRAAYDGNDRVLDRWRIDPRERARDRAPHEIVRTLVLPTERTVRVALSARPAQPSAPLLPVLADVDFTFSP